MNKTAIWIIGIIVVILVIGYFAGWFTKSTNKLRGGGHAGGHGGHGHGGHWRTGWGWGYWYPYYTTATCPTGNCDASDGTIGTWITNADGTCSCKSNKS